MVDDWKSRAWRALTPAQQAMLRRLGREGTLVHVAPWEMRTVRSLLERGLVRPRRTGRAELGLWFLSAKGSRILPGEPDEDAGPVPTAPARRHRPHSSGAAP